MKVERIVNKVILSALLLSCVPVVHAAEINLECVTLSDKLITKLVDESLLLPAEQYQIRAREISTALCSDVQKTAEAQHQEAKAVALKNWIFENKPDKPGNKRLKKRK